MYALLNDSIKPVKIPSSNHFDAIVVGSGISGGWAAKELTEKGLKTLLLERGRNVEHIKDYQGTEKDPWRGEIRIRTLWRRACQHQEAVADRGQFHRSGRNAHTPD